MPKHSHNFNDLVGQVFNLWVVLHLAGKNRHDKAVWFCRCECGTTKDVVGGSLLNGLSKNCGCVRKKWLMTLASKNQKHGHARGGRSTKIYSTYCGMKKRCLNKNDPNYGGRGIAVCARWMESFENFLADMGEPPSSKHSIDRIDNGGNYEPGNCRWATAKQQTRNIRSNRIIEFGGKTKNMSAWAEEFGVSYSVFRGRIRRGYAMIPPNSTSARKE